ncbi:MAG: nucleotidyltransferase domain-containing protein [Candidatus Pacebacteria bacterium]|nr:nucleotidyltransferase domain-containing protein [Candidatus Paceibacterota bacterium]
MIFNLTKNQTLVLEIMFNYPDKDFYFREIAKMLGKEPGVFQKDIKKLVEDGIIETYEKGNRRFFKLNNKHPLYKEIKIIFFKTTGIEGKLKNDIKKIKGIKKSFIYGSFAQGKEKPTSDVDVFVVGTIDENDLIDKLSFLEDKFGREFNYTLMDEKEFKEKSKKDSFVKNVLSQKVIELI